jgi:hypothetical protein
MKYLAIVSGKVFLLGCLLSGIAAQDSPRFRIDDPLLNDPDQNAIAQPSAVRLSQIYDLVENTFINRLKKNETVLPAVNTNTLGDVPNSSWYTNRMSWRIMTISELVKGPNQLEGPDLSQPFEIVGAKTEGITPGFTIRDCRGEIFFVKFDPPDYPQLMTATEVICTKFFYAFGFNVPENYSVFIKRNDLLIGKDAQLTDEEGKERNLMERDLGRIFEKVYQGPDGRIPIVASRRLQGRPLGPFRYYGIRSDDPNDIFPHENRRELRGLRLLSAWLNHDDSRSVNTLDMYLGEPDRGFIKHHLIDFGSCLGSGSVKPQSRRAGNEYIIEWPPILRAALTLGIWDRPWRHVKFPDFRSVGRFEGDFFQPELWRPEYPNPAFDRMLPEDAFWAVRIINRFSDEMVRALVETGRIADREAEAYLVETLIKRRDKITAYYLKRINSLDEFNVAETRLEFRDLAFDRQLVSRRAYQYQWFSYSNQNGETSPLGKPDTSRLTSVDIPRLDSEFLMIRIGPAQGKTIDVFLKKRAESRQVVGIVRESSTRPESGEGP